MLWCRPNHDRSAPVHRAGRYLRPLGNGTSVRPSDGPPGYRVCRNLDTPIELSSHAFGATAGCEPTEVASTDRRDDPAPRLAASPPTLPRRPAHPEPGHSGAGHACRRTAVRPHRHRHRGPPGYDVARRSRAGWDGAEHRAVGLQLPDVGNDLPGGVPHRSPRPAGSGLRGGTGAVARRRAGAGSALRPVVAEMRHLLGVGGHIVVRTSALLAALVLATSVAARVGPATLGAHQIAYQMFIFLALVADAIAVAVQALVGTQLG